MSHSYRWRCSSSHSQVRTNHLVFQSFKRSTERATNHPGFETWNPGACLAAIGMNCDGCTHSIMQFPFSEFATAGRGEGKYLGASWFLMISKSTGKLLSCCFSVNDTHRLCHDTPVWCQGFFTFKVESNCLASQRYQTIWWVQLLSLSDCGTVSGWALDYHPFSAEKCWEVGTYSQKFLAGIIPTPAAKHLHAQPICALEDAVSFSPLMWKKLFSLLYFPLRFFETWSGFQKATAVIEVTN